MTGKNRFGSACIEERAERAFHLVWIGFTLEDCRDFSAAINEEVDGKAKNLAVGTSEAKVAHQDGVVYIALGDEGASYLRVIVEGDGEDLQTLRAVVVLPVDEAGHLHLAGCAPRSPKGEQDNFAAECGEIDAASVEAGPDKARGVLVQQLSWVSRSGARSKRQRGQDDGEREELLGWPEHR